MAEYDHKELLLPGLAGDGRVSPRLWDESRARTVTPAGVLPPINVNWLSEGFSHISWRARNSVRCALCFGTKPRHRPTTSSTATLSELSHDLATVFGEVWIESFLQRLDDAIHHKDASFDAGVHSEICHCQGGGRYRDIAVLEISERPGVME